MSAQPASFNRGVVRPVECIKAGFASIKDDYWLFLGLSIVAILIGSVGPMGILLGPMMCGLHMCLLRRQRGEKVGFDVLFKGFDFFGPSLIATLIQIVPQGDLQDNCVWRQIRARFPRGAQGNPKSVTTV